MKLKSLLFLFLFASFNSINSQQLYPQDGIYGGIETGVALVNLNGTFSNVRFPEESQEFIGLDFTKSVIGVNLGFGRYFEENLVGLEIHHSIYTKKVNELIAQGDFEFDLNIGSKSEIDLILGRKIGTHSLLTLRLGIAFSDLNLIADYTAGSERYVLDKQWIGYSLGMGYVFGISDYLAIKTKYNLTTYNNHKHPETNSKFVDNRVTLSLIYSIWTFE